MKTAHVSLNIPADLQPAYFDMKKDSAKANSKRDTFEAAESLSETSVSINNVSPISEDVNTFRQI